MAKKNKKDSNLLIILLILILLMLIILPPTFRMLFPKEESESSNQVNETKKINNITSLSCRKSSTDGYAITINTTYQNNDVSKITLSYIANTKNDTTNPEQNTTTTTNDATNNNATNQTTETTQTASPVQDNVASEVEVLKTVPNIKTNETDTSFQFQIDMKNFTYKTIPESLNFRVQSLSLQRAFYENLAYTCSVVSN